MGAPSRRRAPPTPTLLPLDRPSSGGPVGRRVDLRSAADSPASGGAVWRRASADAPGPRGNGMAREHRPSAGLVVALVGVVGLLGTLLVRADAPVSGAADARSSTFGAFSRASGGETQQAAVTRLEDQIGRKLPVVRVFVTFLEGEPLRRCLPRRRARTGRRGRLGA